MIGFLSGQPQPFTADSIILNINGVGYKVFVPAKVRTSIDTKTNLELFIHTHVRDDTLDLYGFQTKEELNLFQLIINISGVGPKIGLALLDQGVQSINTAIARADVDFFTAIPRVGKKNAQKIIIELKPKLEDLEELNLIGDSPETKQAIGALIRLGFTKKEAKMALKEIVVDDDNLEEKITKAIKYLGSGKS